jgi:RNA polymerase sigma factor
MNSLIADYRPFIKKTINDTRYLGIEYDDRLSLAMLSFMNSVKQYTVERGNFINFTTVCIRNRLYDENRKHIKHSGKVIPLFPDEEDESSLTIEDKVSVSFYEQDLERENLSIETDALSGHLEQYGVSFDDLHRICPKQERARRQCIDIGRYIISNDEILNAFLKARRLPQSQLAKHFGLSEKTIEKHRKYIVTIVIVLTGDYPYIRAFLPQYEGA